MPLERERAILTRGDREVGSTTRTCRATWVSPKGQGKRRKSFSMVRKKLVNADCVHGQGITIFARDRPQLYRRAKTKEPINQFPAVLFSQ